MNIERRCILFFAPIAFALASSLPGQMVAADLGEAQVTQVVQDVKVVPSGAAARPVTLNETVHQGNAVQTGSQSRSELTFKDQTITRLGEKTIFTVGGQGRTIDMGNGEFLLYVPKKAGGAQIKMGPVTAAITGTTVIGNVSPSGIVEFTVLEGTACIHLDQFGQSLLVPAGYMVVYDPISMSLENPQQVDLQQQLSSPLVKDFRELPSSGLINAEIQNQHRVITANSDLARALSAEGATVDSATPEQFTQALSAVIVRYGPSGVCDLVAGAARSRPDLAPSIAATAVLGCGPGYSKDTKDGPVRVPVRGYSKDAKDFKGKEMGCDCVQCIVNAAIAANPGLSDDIINAVAQAAPMLGHCLPEPCPPYNQPVQPTIITPLTPQVSPTPVSPERPPTSHHHRG